jgi:hypothetical protein
METPEIRRCNILLSQPTGMLPISMIAIGPYATEYTAERVKPDGDYQASDFTDAKFI